MSSTSEHHHPLYNTLPSFPLSTPGVPTMPNATLCQEWEQTHHLLFHLWKLSLLLGMVIPTTLGLHMILLCLLLITVQSTVPPPMAFLCSCNLDVMDWNVVFLVVMTLLCQTKVNRELLSVYKRMFESRHVKEALFYRLTGQFCTIQTLEKGQEYAAEDKTSVDQHLSILLKGRMKVSYRGHFLHNIYTNSFIDSPKFRSTEMHRGERFQVTIMAEENCKFLCWSRERLTYFLESDTFLSDVFRLPYRQRHNRYSTNAGSIKTLTLYCMKAITCEPSLCSRLSMMQMRISMTDTDDVLNRIIQGGSAGSLLRKSPYHPIRLKLLEVLCVEVA
uniref:Popeye domain cAMP effector 1 n=1 Tax=Seriola lalandi dorsalis TaxID=1841481 RepID=A0A3B4XDB3_SERLL